MSIVETPSAPLEEAPDSAVAGALPASTPSGPAAEAPPAAAATEPPAGLTDAEAARRRGLYGRNIPPGRPQLSVVRQFAHQFASPLVVILLLAAGVSGMLGDPVSAAIIGGIVIVSAVLDFFQTYHSQQAADSLRQQVAPRAVVRRGGDWRETARADLVPGDVIRLQAGDLIPADAWVVVSETLYVQQAALTGESLPVEKTASLPEPPLAPPGDPATRKTDPNDPHRLLLGTSVTSGSGVAVITATGQSTAFGQIAEKLASRPPETEFERGMRELSLLITRAVFFLILFVFLASAALHRNALESLLFAVALAVGLTPEFLPMINTVTLGRGAVRMSQKKVIVKHLQSIENLGSMQILCSDKTGTLTTEEMRLDRAIGPTAGRASAMVLALARLNSRFETGIRNTIDEAILAAPPLPNEPDYRDARRVGEIPFDFERRRLSIAVSLPAAADGHPEQALLITKGAPESVLAVCTKALPAEDATTAAPLTGDTAKAAEKTYRTLGQQGFRVLAVAVREIPTDHAPLRAADEAGMTLVGFLALYNPPLADAREVIDRLKQDGVTVKILTGDNELVTAQLCETIGLQTGRIVLGSEMDAMNDLALGQVAEQTVVFARVSPAQKHRIILALKRRGHVVGYIGDGINDAPSLHAADVGISVASAADVARDAAEIILLERSLAVLNDGIVEGRRAFANVQKYLLMNLSSNFGNMLSMAGAAIVLPFLPMLPTQILLNNFLYDLSQVTIPTDAVDAEMVRRPRRWTMKLIRDFMILIGPLSSIYDFLTFWALRTLFHAPESLFHTGWFVESLATQTLVIFVIRTAGVPWRSRASAPLIATIVTAVVVGLVVPFTPLAGPLGFVPLPATFFAFLVAVTVTYLGLVELVKRRLMGHLIGAVS